ncbi:MAG: VWA domain-containing protein [Alphaproteobacteria bacterium]
MSADRDDNRLPSKSNSSQVADFLAKVAATPTVRATSGRGRLMFALDATASREPTWDRACHLQAEMFQATDGLGGLDVQLVFYRGFGECKSSPWVSTSDELVSRMVKVRCLGGRTQLRKVLRHAIKATDQKRVNALVFVGDSLEEEIDEVCDAAGELGVRGVPAFLFQEGNDPIATSAFRQIARLTGGAHCSFDLSSAAQLRELLSAVAVFAAGGRIALENYSKRGGEAVRMITSQLR